MNQFRALLVGAATAAALLLAGCGEAQPTPSQSGLAPETPGSTPTPTATQARETGLVAPARPFGGTCSALMSDAEAKDLFGLALVSYDDFRYAPEMSVELHAGFRCQWASSDGSYSSSISVVVLPADAVTYDPPSGCRPENEETPATCPIESVVNGTRVSGVAWITPSPVGPVQAMAEEFLGLFDERASAATPAPVLIPAVGAWAHPVDCEAVVAAADLSDVAGLGSASVGMYFPFGSHDYASPVVDALEGGSGEFPFCWIDGAKADVMFVAMGGGRWLESAEMTKATPFAIDGYESAYTSPGEEGLTKVDVFDGPNWLHFQILHTSNAKPLADALFEALNETAAK